MENIAQTMAIHKAFQLVVLEPRTTIRMKLLGTYNTHTSWRLLWGCFWLETVTVLLEHT